MKLTIWASLAIVAIGGSGPHMPVKQTEAGTLVPVTAQAAHRSSPAQRPSTTFPYGDHAKQQVDFYPLTEKTPGPPPPLVLYVHGGGWSAGSRKRVGNKPAFFNRSGYAFASTDYRLLPDHSVERQAADIAAAIIALRERAGELGFDADRIVLIGHSAGAHLAALVASDPTYAGADMAAIKGVILLDSAGYDIAANLARSRGYTQRLFSSVFGDDPARHRALSPIAHVGAPDAPHWLMLYVKERARAGEQAAALTLALREEGVQAETLPINNSDHTKLNRRLGTAGDQATTLVDEFLTQLFD